MDKLCTLVESHKPLVVCLVETWLSEDISNWELLVLDYQILHLDHNRHGGRVIMYVNIRLSVKLLLSGPDCLELLAVSLFAPGSTIKHCVTLLCRPPSSSVSFFENLCNTLQFLNLSSYSNVLLIGDFSIDFCGIDPDCRLQSIICHSHLLFLKLSIHLHTLILIVMADTHLLILPLFLININFLNAVWLHH